MEGHFYTSPLFVVPLIWAIFLSGILWGSQALSRKSDHSHDESGH